MADDNNPALPIPNTEGGPPRFEPAAPMPHAVSAVPPPFMNGTTAVPHSSPPAAGAPRQPASPGSEFIGGLLRSMLHLVIGAAVGALAGFILNFVLFVLPNWTGDWRLLTGGGLLVGVLFSGVIVRALRLAPVRDRPAPATDVLDARLTDSPPDGLRDVVEILVFVIVFVLLLKAFDAEAFVIPTGSMAETLLGYQKWVVCPKCGYRFPANASQQIDPTTPPSYWVSGCTCPNCRQAIRFTGTDHESNSAPDAAGAVTLPDPAWGGGDHVLVSKYAYDLSNGPPDRFDVVVFRFPGDEAFPHTGPFKDGVPLNFIKRLIGLPGETIAIHGGDLYLLPASKGPQYDDLKGLSGAEREDKARQLWKKKYEHQNEASDLFRHGDFVILRKPPEVLLAERRIVYDNDHCAKDLTGPDWVRWTDRDADAGWKPDDPHGFRLMTPPDKDKVHWLGYRHVLRDEPGKTQLITDYLGYNTWTGDPRHHTPGEDWVGDLILECEVQPDQAQGELTLELSKGVDRFQVHFDLSSGQCNLYRVGQDKPLNDQPKATALKGGGKHTVRFANVDQRLTVWVDDVLPFGDGVPYDPPKTEGPTENDLQPASIGMKNVGGTVHGLRLWRDTYYTAAKDDNANSSDHGPTLDFSDPGTWRNWVLPTKTLYVQPGHFLCLGDNSPESYDGRFWGLVPERLLLGKAVAVYYPFDRFGRIR
ncbi:MAG TPA: S26 family signal peptidase [Gemmataceae bacterium]|nr:S26 family signal peptidase [Gemmataceae bacterium]